MTASSAPRPMSERTRPTLSRSTKTSSPPIAISTTTNIPFKDYAPADRTPTAKGSDLARDDHLRLIAQDRPDHAERRSLPSPAPATLPTKAPATSRAHAPLQDGSITPNEAMSRSSDREASALLDWTSRSGPAAYRNARRAQGRPPSPRPSVSGRGRHAHDARARHHTRPVDAPPRGCAMRRWEYYSVDQRAPTRGRARRRLNHGACRRVLST